MASALIQMTAFSPCSQLGDMIMVGAEGSLESFPGLREEGYKRSHFDGDEEQDRSHVKKRRKQSKPIRITSADTVTDIKGSVLESGKGELDFSETGEHFLTEGLVEVNASSLPNKEVYEDLPQMNQDQNITNNDNQDKSEKSDKMYNSLLPLNLSGIKPSFMESLVVPNVGDSHNSTSKLVPIDSLSQFQSTAHESSKTPIAQESSFLSQSPSLLLPLFKQTQIQGQISQITSQMRIFNPEAFCDLCNKEFCNKYFLKTHKANKHGIYTESPSGQSLLEQMPSLPFTNYFSTNNDSYENPSTFQGSSTSKSLFNQTTYTPNRNIPKKIQTPQPQPPPQQQQNNLYSLKSNSSGNMRALCNICQREFCNKYFVRRHKLKIHGIIDPITKDNSVNDLQENNNMNSQDKVDTLVSEGESYGGYLKQFIPTNFSLEIRDLSLNPETNLDKSKEKQEKEVESDTKITILPHNIPTSTENSSLFKTASSQNEENNKENNISSNRLKKFGVINADAFCDICCKEYCNKYFLRTHKLKSHGILPVEDKKEDTFNGNTSGMLWYQNQTTPLNLIVNDSSTNRDIPDKSNFDSEGEECICTICGRYFQGQVLLKMHQAYAHPNKYITNEIPPPSKQNIAINETLRNKDATENDKLQQPLSSYSPVGKSECLKDADENQNKSIINTANLQKLQNLISRLNNSNISESSTCDVCEKDVGHVSLLENHVLKEHALLLEEMGNITEEDNSSSQSSLAPSSYSFKKECPHCQHIFFKLSLLEQHINDVHGDLETHMDSEGLKGSSEFKDSNNSSKMNLVPFPTQSPEDRQGLQTPASSFCEICKKELCNKYFMKTHMQRMHGISIENGAQIGGVVCDICNKELCSKYFLRVHKQNSHGIVDELFLPQIGLDFVRNQSPNMDPALKPTDQTDLNHRYFTHFNEVCTICNRRFRSVKWLKAHLLNDHGEEGKERWKDMFLLSGSESKPHQLEENLKETGKLLDFSTVFSNSSNQLNNISSENIPNGSDSSDRNSTADKSVLNNTMFSMLMNGKDSETKHYQCSYCSFTTSILAFLFIHERSHMNTRSFQIEADQPFQCPICCQNLESKEQFENHKKLHKISWQQMYTSDGSNQDLPKSSGKLPETRNDVIVVREKSTHLDQDVSDVLQSHHESKPSLQSEQTNESSIQCSRCGFSTSNMQLYLNHVNKEHPYLQMDQELPSHLQQMEKLLSALACNVGIPAVFAAPRVQDQVTMQPFVLEDSEYISNTNNSIDPNPGKTFLSSLVFLPVKEKLKKSVTASFKLTPT